MNDNEKRVKAEMAFKLLLEKLDRHSDSQEHLAESLDKISELGYDAMQAAINIIDKVEKYEQVFDGLLEHYATKVTDKTNKFFPLFQAIGNILDKVKNLRSERTEED